jgi:HEAT repeat protein
MKKGKDAGNSTSDKPNKKRSFEKLGGKTLAEWIKDLQNRDPSVRRDAIQAVQFYGEDSCDAVPQLVRILSYEKDVALRINAAGVLRNVEVLNRDVPSVVKALAWLIDNPQLNLRYTAIGTIARFEDDAVEAIPKLVFATRDQGSWEVRQAACYALARVGANKKGNPADPRVTKALIDVIQTDPAAKVRLEACMYLGLLNQPHPKLKNALQTALLKQLRDPDKGVVVWAYFGLINTGGGVTKGYRDAMNAMLKKGDVPTKMHVLNALARLGREAKPHLKNMIDALEDSDPMVACTACMVLAHLSEHVGGPAAEKAINDMIARKGTEEVVKFAGKRALAMIRGNDGKPANVKETKVNRK